MRKFSFSTPLKDQQNKMTGIEIAVVIGIIALILAIPPALQSVGEIIAWYKDWTNSKRERRQNKRFAKMFGL